MLKGKCESKLQPNCIYGLPSPSFSLSVSFSFSLQFAAPHTHTQRNPFKHFSTQFAARHKWSNIFSQENAICALLNASCVQAALPLSLFLSLFPLSTPPPLSLSSLSISSLSFDGENCIDQRKTWGWPAAAATAANKKLVAVCLVCWRGVWATLTGIKT